MIVVTGATGHIGNVLVRKLQARGEKVRAVLPPGEDSSPLAGLKVEIVPGDVRDRQSLVHAFQGAEAVFHLAGIISILPGEEELLYKVNVQGTENVIAACLHSGVKRLVFTSSIHALAELPHGTVIDETSPFDASRIVGEYGKTKCMASLKVLESVKNRGLEAIVVCPTGVIGPFDYKLSATGKVIRDFIARKLIAYIKGAYDFVDVRDVAAGLILAYEKGCSGQVYILSGERITLAALLAILEEETGIKYPRVELPLWLAHAAAAFTPYYYRLTKIKPYFTKYSLYLLTSNSLFSHEKATCKLGYSPRPLRETLRDTAQWIKANFKAARTAKGFN